MATLELRKIEALYPWFTQYKIKLSYRKLGQYVKTSLPNRSMNLQVD